MESRFTPIPAPRSRSSTLYGPRDRYADRKARRPAASSPSLSGRWEYRWAVYFSGVGREGGPRYGFNMDEWCDRQHAALGQPGRFPLPWKMPSTALLIVPAASATATGSASYLRRAHRCAEGRRGAERGSSALGACSISLGAPLCRRVCYRRGGKQQTHWLVAKLHPLTIEQNAITSFKSRTTLVPARQLSAPASSCRPTDHWRLRRRAGHAVVGHAAWTTLRYGPNCWVPQLHAHAPGRLFFLEELAGPLVAECNRYTGVA